MPNVPRSVVALLLGAIVALPSAAFAATTIGKSDITVSGYFDGYFQYQFSHPSPAVPIGGRVYVWREAQPTLGLAWLDIAKPAKPKSLGFKVSLAAGDYADGDVPAAGSGTGEAQFKSIAQAYGTYMGPNGFTADLGKFLSPYGFDTTVAQLNWNYTLTDATFLVPNYLAGVRATYPFKGCSVSGYVVSDLEETATSGVQEDNGTKDFILRLNYTTPDGKFNYIPAVGFGKDKLPGPLGKGNEDIVLWDNWLTYKAAPKTTLAGEYVYRKDKDKGGLYNLRGDGYGVYVHQELTPTKSVTVRYSALAKHMDTLAPAPVGSSSFRADEVTVTYEQKFAPNFSARLEYRHDHSNNPALFGFPDENKPIPVGHQDAVIVAGLFSL